MAAGRIAQGPNALDKQWLEAEKFALASDNLPAVVVVNPDGSNIAGGGGGGGLAVVDEAAWTAGTSTFTPSGGVFNDSATALTSGQQGTERLTPNRAVHTNLRNNAGTEVGTSATPLQVSLANTATNATAVKVDGSGVTQPVSGSVGTATAAINVNQQTVNTTAVQVSASSTIPTNGILVGALSTNSASIFVGGSGVTTANGAELQPGASMPFTCNLNTIYIISAASTTDKIWWNVT